MHKFPRYLLVPTLLLAAIIGFLIWGSTPLGPSQVALEALRSDHSVKTYERSFFTFIPVDASPTTGFIIYPGGRVDWRSYAPIARAIAEEGYLVSIVPMPLSLAVLSPGSAADVIDKYPGIRYWVIGGHSLGGAMAAYYAYKNPDGIQGLVLWAAYPAASNSLRNYSLKVMSIFASQDGLATKEKIDASRSLLPVDTVWVEIAGGNHAQFGSYGTQPGDGSAEISADEQLRQVAAATVSLLKAVEER